MGYLVCGKVLFLDAITLRTCILRNQTVLRVYYCFMAFHDKFLLSLLEQNCYCLCYGLSDYVTMGPFCTLSVLNTYVLTVSPLLIIQSKGRSNNECWGHTLSYLLDDCRWKPFRSLQQVPVLGADPRVLGHPPSFTQPSIPFRTKTPPPSCQEFWLPAESLQHFPSAKGSCLTHG